jgi:hypothetical protein
VISHSIAAPCCARCGYALGGLVSPGVCPECGRPFDFADPSSFLSRPPFIRWKFWLPGLALGAAAGIVVTAILAFCMGNWGSALWIGMPLMVGTIVGYRCRTEWYMLPLLGLGAFLAVVAGLMSMSLAGVFCAMILFTVFLVPLLVGVGLGAALRGRLKLSAFSQRGYLPLIGMVLLPLAWGAAQGPPREDGLETVQTSVVVRAPVARCWEVTMFYEEVPGRAPLLLRIGLARPLHTTGSARHSGDVKVCTYNKGHITKRILAVEPGRLLSFRVVDQRIGYERDVRLVGGSFRFEPIGPELTRIVLTTTYRPRLGPRLCWRWGEHLAVHLLHNHVLEGMRTHALEPIIQPDGGITARGSTPRPGASSPRP